MEIVFAAVQDYVVCAMSEFFSVNGKGSLRENFNLTGIPIL